MSTGFPLAQLQHFLNRLPQATFRVQHKLGREHDLFSGFQAIQYLKLVFVALESDIDFTGLKLALTDSNKNNFSNPTVNDSLLGNYQAILGND